MTDKRLYPNTVIFQTTDGKGVTYYNASVLEQIRAEIADLDDADYDYEGYYKAVTDALQIIDKHTKGDTDV